MEEERGKVEELIANISHQTKTPITTIRLYAGLLEEKDLPEEEHLLARRIAEQNDRMAFLIENLVKMSRLENGIVAVHPVKQDIAVLMESLAGIFEKNEERRILFDPSYRSQEPIIACYDLKWTVEAISNIIENAIKYNISGGTVTVTATQRDKHIYLAVEDTGNGIPEELKERIFEPFFRLDKSRSRALGGVGLGLALVHEIVRVHAVSYTHLRAPRH